MTDQQTAGSTTADTPHAAPMPVSDAPIVFEDVTMAYGDFVVQRDLNFTVKRGG